MSHGPGIIERRVEQTLQGSDKSFTVEELCKPCYPEASIVEKKHRVSVLRAFENVGDRLPLWTWNTHRPPWRIIIANRHNVRSWTHGYLRGWYWDHERSLEEIDNILNDPVIRTAMEPGGLLWIETEICNYECEMAYYRLPSGERIHDLLTTTGIRREEVPEEYRQLKEEEKKLRTYKRLVYKGHHGNITYALFGRFEPPGTPVFEWSVKHSLEIPPAYKPRNRVFLFQTRKSGGL